MHMHTHTHTQAQAHAQAHAAHATCTYTHMLHSLDSMLSHHLDEYFAAVFADEIGIVVCRGMLCGWSGGSGCGLTYTAEVRHAHAHKYMYIYKNILIYT